MTETFTTRPLRYAALLVGALYEDVARRARNAEHVQQVPRGIVVLEERSVAMAYDDASDVTIYEVTHYLDNHDFTCAVTRAGKVGLFTRPPTHGTFGLSRLSDVEGETEPRAIVRSLGIAEIYMFPEVP